MIEVRATEDKDIDEIRHLYAGEKAQAGTLQLPHPSFTMWQKRLTDMPSNVHSLVAEFDGRIVGQLGLVLELNPRRRHVASVGMAVHDDYQGQGVGSTILAAAVDLAENWLNISRIELTVYTDNEAGVALYKKLGFIEEGVAAQFAFRNGKYVDALYMAKVKRV
ncbi:GNAT family N-acetyltransferase [Photobacterium sanguinicancri]|uniref:GNAT family N-acetyltransferase n=1 Tax=Photobacterium sanguinicancri TaxID=875932 RepID=A0AAW7Y4S1_9GAMM|nr:GNAT family N-acetyltransferase [Photobacterium sanguinicancri]KXI21686.1 GCN5 family acetyltransferase [Photobacterium sanguinicancri]MDO6541953.1 GNAT family N-acetyltransferase [Photobacterium sanguinicancri]